nr:YbaN family protein [uncultured Brevundimonas sp.]
MPPFAEVTTMAMGQRSLRAGWLVLGLILVGLGFVGVFVPLMPTTIFIILAAACFTRSSPRLEAWLLNHSRFGPTLRAWRAEGAAPRRAKIAACLGMALGYGLFWLAVRPGLWLGLAVAVVMAACAIFVASRPSPGGRDGG